MLARLPELILSMRFFQFPSVSLAIQLLVALAAVRGASAFYGIDETTSGAWVQQYGAQGYMIPEGPVQMNWPTVDVMNAQTWVWTRSTALPQAPVYPFARGGIATCWYSETRMTAAVYFPDRNRSPVAFYFLDWDKQKRVQKIELLDFFGQPTAEFELRDFENGKYIVIGSSDMGLRITRIAGPNAVLSGVFVGGAFNGSPLATPPVISPNGGEFADPVEVQLFAATGGSAYFTANGTDPAVNGMPYSGPMRLLETTTIRAVTRNRYGTSPEAVATFTIAPLDRPEFLGEDRTTLGSWKGNYGNGGYAIPMFDATLPVTHVGNSSWAWNWSTQDPSALQRPTASSDRLAACWYSGFSFDISIPIGRDTERTIAVYALDWDNAGRVQQVDLIDTENQIVVDSRTISDFADGVYLRWKVRNDVSIRVINRGGPNVVLSGVFLDPGPVERLNAPSFIYGSDAGEPVSVTLGSDTPGAEIHYTLDGSTPTRSSDLYTGPFYVLHDTTVSAIAYKDGMLPSPVASVFIEANETGSGGGAAEFMNEDGVTHGTWRGAYGAAGYWIAGDATSFPPNFGAEFFGAQQHIWAFNITDPAALQKAGSPERIAACRYAADRFSVVAGQSDGAIRVVSLYFLDWDEASRIQKVEVLDQSGTVVDTRNIFGFADGKYLTWRVTGQVTFRITRVQGLNAVLSGIFID
jgi:hypothetical protein